MITKTAIDQVNDALMSHDSPIRVWLVGAPWFDPPFAILDGLKKVSAETSFPYPPSQGLDELREAVCTLHLHEGVALSPEQVVVTQGAKSGITATLGCLLGPGTELMYPIPSYPAYATIARTLGATPVSIPQWGSGFSLTSALLEEYLTPQTRAVVLSSPCNPTGAVLSNAQAKIAVDFCRRYGLRLICDEAYAAFDSTRDRGNGPIDHDPTLETVVVVRSFSKIFAVCGWRIGYIVGDAELTSRIGRWQSAMLNPPNILAQKSLVSAPEVPPDLLAHNRRKVRLRLENLAAALAGVGLKVDPPEGGFYLWIDVRPLLKTRGFASSLELCLELAFDQGIGLWPGEDFHCPGFVRISAVGCPDEAWDNAVSGLTSAVRLLSRDQGI